MTRAHDITSKKSKTRLEDDRFNFESSTLRIVDAETVSASHYAAYRNHGLNQ
jgi:hypothetical protein